MILMIIALNSMLCMTFIILKSNFKIFTLVVLLAWNSMILIILQCNFNSYDFRDSQWEYLDFQDFRDSQMKF